MKKYWLVKTEPETYSYQNLIQETKACWDGVRNYRARNYLRKMKVGDFVYIYHTGKEKRIVGDGQVSKEAYSDPTDNTGQWSAVDIQVNPVKKEYSTCLSLAEIKANPIFQDSLLVKQSRLSVMPLSQKEVKAIQERVKR